MRRQHRGFSLLELIVAIVLMLIIASVSYVAYLSLLDGTRDKTGQATVASIGREAQSLASLRSRDAVDDARFVIAAVEDARHFEASADFPDRRFRPLEDDPTRFGAPGVGWSGMYGEVSFKIGSGADTGKAGLAMVTENGYCSFVVLTGVTQLEMWVVQQDLEAACAGSVALEGPGPVQPVAADDYAAP